MEAFFKDSYINWTHYQMMHSMEYREKRNLFLAGTSIMTGPSLERFFCYFLYLFILKGA